MKPPRIGLTTTSLKLDNLNNPVINHEYPDAVRRAGGIPISIQTNDKEGQLLEIFFSLDGILFTGGGDIAELNELGFHDSHIKKRDPLRDKVEFFLLANSIKYNKPFLGICRGCQLLNVALGGTLYTHIKDQLPGAIKHDYFIPRFPRNKISHDITLDLRTKLGRIIGETPIQVNSRHHQGIRNIADPLTACGTALDGLIEAVEVKDHPFGCAVQWHPESLMDQAASQRIFKSFINSSMKEER